MSKDVTRSKLLDMKRDLSRRLEAIDADFSVPLDQDSEERVTQVENEEVLLAMKSDCIHDLKEIDAALQRLQIGTYGECVRCHEMIETARLDAVPQTPFCMDCAMSLP